MLSFYQFFKFFLRLFVSLLMPVVARNHTLWRMCCDTQTHSLAHISSHAVHCKTPEYLSNILETQTSKDGTHNTISNNSIREIFARTKLYYESFFPSTIRLWNTLPNEIQNNPSLNNFKKYLNRSNINIPDYYNFGSRKGQILHSQLRLESSALKLYMFRRNLCPSPLCTCGSIESNDHYLLYCPNYNVIRSETINKLRDSTNVNILLFGSSNLSVNDNKYIFYMVQKFIIDSKRFQGT